MNSLIVFSFNSYQLIVQHRIFLYSQIHAAETAKGSVLKFLWSDVWLVANQQMRGGALSQEEPEALHLFS